MNPLRLREIAAGCVLGCLLGSVLVEDAVALPRYGPFEVSGNVSAQQLIRFNPDIDTYALVQQRNTLKLRLDYQLMERGRLADRIDVPLLDRAKLFLLYRGVYDSVYDATPGFAQRDIYGQRVAARLDDFTTATRNSLKFEDQLREAYIDVAFKKIPLSFRLGRQQIVWGETDNFRMLDRVNALDLTWHLQQESWDELRIPYWMIKGLWNFEQLGPLSNSFLEFYWNPGDWYPAKRAFLPRPWSAPITDPIPVLVNAFHTLGNPQMTSTLYHGTELFLQGDYTRNPQDNSQVGTRFSAVTPQGVQFTLNYFYQRWAGDDGTNAASYAAVLDKTAVNNAIKQGQLPIEAIAPYVHTAGFSLNYADEDYTQAVFRTESIYEFGVPFSDSQKPSPNGLLARDVFGVSKRDMWKGMLAFDRPTWIRPLNRKATFLVLGQFFWHYLVDNPNVRFCKDNDPADRDFCRGKAPATQSKGFRGEFSSSGPPLTATPFFDKVRDWEVLTTLAMTTFYRGGKIVPLLVYVLDPVNSYNMEVNAQVDYFITNNVILNLAQRYFINTTSAPVFESWGVGGINRGRSETGVRLTYQF
jgi:Protein of unknown function (DUF1302)